MHLVHYTVSQRVASIIINRPDKRNALNPELVRQLTNAFEDAESDPQVKVVLFKASGDVFSAGADLEYLQQLQNHSEEENLQDSESLKKLFLQIYALPKLVIAQVEGHAIAGGCGLISVCDIVFSVPEAKFGYTEVRIGFIPALVTCFLIRKLGESRTNELLLSGELIPAETASQYGLINFVTEKETIDQEVKNYIHRILTGTSANSVSQTKSLIRLARDLPLEQALDVAVRLNVQARASEDCKRGIAAFVNKGKLEW